MKLVTADQMRGLEQQADRSGNTFAKMMERAGAAVAESLRVHLAARSARENRVLVLVGPGNNGGDGLVCARALFDAGAPVSLYLWKRAQEQDPNLGLCIERNIPLARAEEDTDFRVLKRLLTNHEVIVDALLGTGVTRPIEGTLKDLLGIVKSSLGEHDETSVKSIWPSPHTTERRAPLVVAVDLPSGLNPDTGALDDAAVPADLTVTFAFPKIGQLLFPAAGAVGELVVADIGIPNEWAKDILLEVASAQDTQARLPRRAQNSHKGTFGKAMICAGSINYVGAAYLAGTAATRVGAGLVTLAMVQSLEPMIAAAAHETTYLPLPHVDGGLIPEAVEILVEGADDYNALAIGSGFGRRPGTIGFVQRLFGLEPGGTDRASELPSLVVDADALYALSQSPEWWTRLGSRVKPMILTPHPGEMATLCGRDTRAVQEDRIGTARHFAQEWRQIVVLKGAHTVVAALDGRVTLIPFATPALATAGTGDVLAGTIAGFLAQGLAAFDAAVVGAYVHGLAGMLVAEEVGEAGAVAADLLPRLPRAISRITNKG